MSQPSPEGPSEPRAVWPLVGALVFLVVSLAAAGMVVGGFDPASLFPTPTNPPGLILLTDIPPTPTPTPTATPLASGQVRLRVALIPPQGDTTDLTERLPEAILSALEGTSLAGLVAVETGDARPEDALQIAWEASGDAPISLTFHTRFEPAPARVGETLQPYYITGPETTPLIVDPADGMDQPAGLAAALLELGHQPDPRVIDRINRLQLLPSSLGPEDQAGNQAMLMFALAQGQAAPGDLTLALNTYSQALRLRPDFPAAALNRGSVYLALGDAATALAAYAPFEDQPSYQTVVSYNRALATLSGEDLDAALSSVEELVGDPPATAWGANLRGYIYYRRAEYDAALADFRQASDLSPATPTLLFNQAETLMSLGQPDAALEVYGALTVLEPANPVYRFKQAMAFKAAGNIPSALDALSQAIVLDGAYVDAYLERAQMEVQAEDCEKAQADAEQVLALEPDNGPAYQVSGECLLAQEEWVQAEKAYATAEKNGVRTIELYAGRGWAHHRQEEVISAIRDYQQAIELGSNDTTLLLRLGYALIDANRRKEALNALLGAVNGGLDTPDAHAGLALALDMNRRADEAEIEYQHALSLDPRYEDREYLFDQPLWNSISIARAMAIVKRLK